VVRVLPRPNEPAGYQPAAAALRQAFPTDAPSAEALSLHELDCVLLIASWFRRFPKEQQAMRDPTALLAECVAKG
jgi:hypothetical protein